MCDFFFLTVCECFFGCCPKGMVSDSLCVYVYVNFCVCMHLYVHICVCVYVYVVCICKYVCVFKCLYVFVCILHIYVCVCLSIMCICAFVCICACMYVCIGVCVHMCKYSFMDITFLQGSTLAPHHPQTGIKSRVGSLYSTLSLGASIHGIPGSRVWACSVQMLSSSLVLCWLCFCPLPVITIVGQAKDSHLR